MSKSLLAALVMLGGAAAADPMTFTVVSSGGNCTGCTWVVAEGEIVAETPDAFRSFLAETEYRYQIMFDSPGGSLGAALELGRMIRDNEISTGIARSVQEQGSSWHTLTEGGRCESACAFAFLAGTGRFANETWDNATFMSGPRSGALGMHQFYSADGQSIPTAATQQIMGQVLHYVLELDINPQLLSISSQTPPDDMYYFSRSELVQLGVLTAQGGSDHGLVVEKGALAVTWDQTTDSGDLDRRIWLTCRDGSWLLKVRQFDVTAVAAGFASTENPMQAALDGGPMAVPPGSVVSLADDGNDSEIEVRLPFDPTATPGAQFAFYPVLAGSARYATLLAAEGMLPDAETLSVMSRSCAP